MFNYVTVLCFNFYFYFTNLHCILLIISILSAVRHKGSWFSLREESCDLRKRGLADGTWKNKVSHLRAYLTFTTYYNAQDFPVLQTVILRFIAFLGRGPHASGSATNIISNIKWFASFIDPASVAKVFESVMVSATLKGLKSQLSRPPKQKLPFSAEHLLMFYNVLDFREVQQLAAWCAMLLAFFGCFRASNLVPPSKNKFDPLKHLKVNDIKFNGDIVLVYYKFSKTNQSSAKVSWVPIFAVKDVRFNLKMHLKMLFDVAQPHAEAPLFSYTRKEFHSKMSLVRTLDKCLFETGLSLADYSWHSFRRGAAVFAFELGLSDTAVQLLGDWASPAFQNYLEFSFDRKLDVANKISRKFNSAVKHL